jgi:hypothetical protein
MESKPHNEPSQVTAAEVEVLVGGPNGHAFSFTPEAAAETSDRLLEGSAEARGQQVEKEREKGRQDQPTAPGCFRPLQTFEDERVNSASLAAPTHASSAS